MYQTLPPSTVRNQRLLAGLQTLIDEWRDEFENPPSTKLEFTADPMGMLYFNGIPLCPASHIDSPESLSCDCEVFTLHTNAGAAFEILIEWPFSESGEEMPYLSRITMLRDLYVCMDHECRCCS